EQVRGREVDGRADLYALGCVLYEMLTGERLFAHANTPMAAALAHVEDAPPPLPATVREPLRQLVARLLEKDPARRPARAAAVAAALAPAPRRRGVRVTLVLFGIAAAGLVGWRASRKPEWRPAIRELRPESEEEVGFAAFSPDATEVAYTSTRSGAWRL